MTLTASQILDLAPDAASRKAGQDQAKPGKWDRLGRVDTLIWGEIKGSGATPYRTVCDLTGPASKCSCPSRKFPCKHGLGLMLIATATPLVDAEPPDWAAAWAKGRDTRNEKGEAKASDAARPVDEKAQVRRQKARAARVFDALDELDLWLRDLMRRGLATARGEPYAFWDRMAARLVDGQAPGLARRVRALPGLIAAASVVGAARPEAALALAIGRIGLLLRAARRQEVLSSGQAAQVRAAIGYPVSAEELDAQPDQVDDWVILAHTLEEEDKLRTRSVWLVGRGSGKVAQVIDYGTAGSPLPPVPPPGWDHVGVLCFHPGDPCLRAAFREGRAGPSPSATMPGATSVATALDGFADVLARAPWTERWPLRLAAVRFGQIGNGESAIGVGDATGCIALRADPRLPALLTVAMDQAVELFGLYDGVGIMPLALVADGHLYTLPAQDSRPVLVRAA